MSRVDPVRWVKPGVPPLDRTYGWFPVSICERPRPRDHRRDPDGQQPRQRMAAAALLPRVRDLGKEIKKVVAARTMAGGLQLR
jgi:hypothetical protein